MMIITVKNETTTTTKLKYTTTNRENKERPAHFESDIYINMCSLSLLLVLL